MFRVGLTVKRRPRQWRYRRLAAPELVAAKTGAADCRGVDLNRRGCNTGGGPLDRNPYAPVGRKRPAPVRLLVAVASAAATLRQHDRTARRRRLAPLVGRLVVGAHRLRARARMMSIRVLDSHLQLTSGHRRQAESQHLTSEVVAGPIRDRELEPARVRDAVDERDREAFLGHEHDTRANPHPALAVQREPWGPP